MFFITNIRLLLAICLVASTTASHAAKEQVQVPPSVQMIPQPPSLPLPVEVIEEQPALPPMIDLTISPDDLWQRMRNGFGMADLNSPLVAGRQSWYLNRPDMLRRIFERGQRYLYHIVVELEKRGMPTELALLPMVESAYNPLALSSARALGIWQFIPSTGKSYNLDQNWWVDERRDIIASTDAALNYLQTIYEMHGDWHLALASYNWGENAVARAIAKNQTKGLPTDYASLTMPTETRFYVPKLQALKNIVAQPELFGFNLAAIPNEPYFKAVLKPNRMDVAVAARLAEMSIEDFILLNPAYHRPVMNGHQAGPLVLPVGKVDTFNANLERHTAQDMPLSNWQTHTLKRGETLDKLAAQRGIDVTRLKQINGITARTKIGPGLSLLVPRLGSKTSHEQVSRALPKLPPEKAIAAKGKRAKKTNPPATKPAAKPTPRKTAKPLPKNPPTKK
ncbi:MAG: transglycosylase SLT domain-containing protein [Gammaproteobacteria bacterium]|nr:LysM peptidoglycan-binding domain-containing protein [Rhodocyclaceae bacterium]MBU3910006.1 transglycosylase SLT domain-containing protein [Gammaproteobacteria bacterium]MBU4003979.1 transglycosylase SLT domain-containing protein [Gammaproteobacteria bacterium]MBU4020226.1 transglycosylase SLT domain-containing protein [Gammaproteobacteria bacterium]MBU4095350.1 transglycosylase SLT domain-containing protein [Gammaproteobacteria bacterium]